MRIMFLDEHVDNNSTLIGGIYLDMDEIRLIIDAINSAWDKLGTEWDFHYVKDKKIVRNEMPVSEIFLNSLHSYFERRHTLIVVHKDVEALKKHNDEFYPTVIFNLYSFPVFLSRSDYALIDKNPQVTVMKNIIEKIGYPKIFYDVDMLVHTMDIDTKNHILKIIKNIIRSKKGIAIQSLDRAYNLRKEEAIKRVMKWGLFCADYVVSSMDKEWRKVDIYGREI